jgi:signal transduction histidine kinase
MSQINLDRNPDDNAGARTAATNNITWAIAVVLIIAAVAIAIVYVMVHVHV